MMIHQKNTSVANRAMVGSMGFWFDALFADTGNFFHEYILKLNRNSFS